VALTTTLAGNILTASGLTSFSDFGIAGDANNPLPVTLTFNGSKSGNGNVLSWTSSSESNNKGFYLERSADGTSFSSIAFVATKAENGNSTSSLNYSFVDGKPFSGTNYYRLMQIDRDGKTSYSTIVILKGEKTGLAIAALYPNPARNEMKLSVVTLINRNVTISITDVSGKEVKRMNYAIVAGDNNINLNVSSLAAGTYYLRLTSGTETKTTRFIKN
jgi:hypothetical protein